MGKLPSETTDRFAHDLGSEHSKLNRFQHFKGSVDEFLEHARRAYSTKGIMYVIQEGLKLPGGFLWVKSQIFHERFHELYFRFTRGGKRFVFNGKRLPYLNRRYNLSWENERAVEVPIVLSLITKERRRRVLEVGNVLPHYVKFPHDVVDKYEIGVA